MRGAAPCQDIAWSGGEGSRNKAGAGDSWLGWDGSWICMGFERLDCGGGDGDDAEGLEGC